MTYPSSRPRRKIIAPKRYDKNEEKKEIPKKCNIINNKYCSQCNIVIDNKCMISFEINNVIYCVKCYNEVFRKNFTKNNSKYEKDIEKKYVEKKYVE